MPASQACRSRRAANTHPTAGRQGAARRSWAAKRGLGLGSPASTHTREMPTDADIMEGVHDMVVDELQARATAAASLPPAPLAPTPCARTRFTRVGSRCCVGYRADGLRVGARLRRSPTSGCAATSTCPPTAPSSARPPRAAVFPPDFEAGRRPRAHAQALPSCRGTAVMLDCCTSSCAPRRSP